MSTFDLFSSYYEENQEVSPATRPMGRRQARVTDKKKRRTKTVSKTDNDESEVGETLELESSKQVVITEKKNVTDSQGQDLFKLEDAQNSSFNQTEQKTVNVEPIVDSDSESSILPESESESEIEEIPIIQDEEHSFFDDKTDESVAESFESEVADANISEETDDIKSVENNIETESASDLKSEIGTTFDKSEIGSEVETPMEELVTRSENALEKTEKKVEDLEQVVGEATVSGSSNEASNESFTSSVSIEDENPTEQTTLQEQTDEAEKAPTTAEQSAQKPVISLKKPSFGLSKVLQRKDEKEDPISKDVSDEKPEPISSKEAEKPVAKPVLSLKKLFEEKIKEAQPSNVESDIEPKRDTEIVQNEEDSSVSIEKSVEKNIEEADVPVELHQTDEKQQQETDTIFPDELSAELISDNTIATLETATVAAQDVEKQEEDASVEYFESDLEEIVPTSVSQTTDEASESWVSETIDPKIIEQERSIDEDLLAILDEIDLDTPVESREEEYLATTDSSHIDISEEEIPNEVKTELSEIPTTEIETEQDIPTESGTDIENEREVENQNDITAEPSVDEQADTANANDLVGDFELESAQTTIVQPSVSESNVEQTANETEPEEIQIEEEVKPEQQIGEEKPKKRSIFNLNKLFSTAESNTAEPRTEPQTEPQTEQNQPKEVAVNLGETLEKMGDVEPALEESIPGVTDKTEATSDLQDVETTAEEWLKEEDNHAVSFNSLEEQLSELVDEAMETQPKVEVADPISEQSNEPTDEKLDADESRKVVLPGATSDLQDVETTAEEWLKEEDNHAVSFNSLEEQLSELVDEATETQPKVEVADPISEQSNEPTDEKLDADESRKVVLPGLGSIKKRLNPGFKRYRSFQMPVLPKRVKESIEEIQQKEQEELLPDKSEITAEIPPLSDAQPKQAPEKYTLEQESPKKEEISAQIEDVSDSILDEIILEETEENQKQAESEVNEEPPVSIDEVDELLIDEIEDIINEVEQPVQKSTPELAQPEQTWPQIPQVEEPFIRENTEDWLADSDIDSILTSTIQQETEIQPTIEPKESVSTAKEIQSNTNEGEEVSSLKQEVRIEADDFTVDNVDFSDLFEQLIEDVIEDKEEPVIPEISTQKTTVEQKETTSSLIRDAISQIDKSISQLESIEEIEDLIEEKNDAPNSTQSTTESDFLDELLDSELTNAEENTQSVQSEVEKEKEEAKSEEQKELSLAELLRREITQATQAEAQQHKTPDETEEQVSIFGESEQNEPTVDAENESQTEQELSELAVESESDADLVETESDSPISESTSVTEENDELEVTQLQDQEPDWYVKLISEINEKNAAAQVAKQQNQSHLPEKSESLKSTETDVKVDNQNDENQSDTQKEKEETSLETDWLAEIEAEAKQDETVSMNKEEELLAEEKEKSGWTPKSSVEIPVYISNSIREKTNQEQAKTARGKFAKKAEAKSESNGDQMPLPDFDPLAVYKGMVRRWFIINRHTIGLFVGGLIAFRNALPKSRTRGMKFLFTRIAAAIIKPFLAKELRDKSFAVQLRRRLELMGPTYIKLGQILALREDILPTVVTEELKNLLDRLPQIPFADIKGIIEAELGVPMESCFKEVNRTPIGTASIAQTHLAKTIDDERVVLKVVKPGIRDSILTDIRLLKLISGFLQWAIPQYQPKMLIDEFCAYTEKEVDLTNEADHAEIFAANFTEMEGVRFPKIYREYSGADVLCMEFMDGYKPGAPQMEDLSIQEREYLVDRGAASIIQMLYKDGFFHADLHPGNLMILQGPELGFIDLGMVGRFEDKTRRRMLYYFHALVTGDIDGATKYLLAMAKVGDGGDPQGFRRAVADVLRRYYMHSKSGDFSLGKLILNSLSIGGKYRVFFPVEMTLMVKALVTFEGVGYMLVPRLDVPALSEKYVSKIFRDQFNPKVISQELMRGTPELVDMLVQLPKISADGLKFLEEFMNDRSPSNPLEGVKSAIIAGSLLVGGVIAFVQDAHMGVYLSLLGLSGLFALFGK